MEFQHKFYAIRYTNWNPKINSMQLDIQINKIGLLPLKKKKDWSPSKKNCNKSYYAINFFYKKYFIYMLTRSLCKNYFIIDNSIWKLVMIISSNFGLIIDFFNSWLVFPIFLRIFMLI